MALRPLRTEATNASMPFSMRGAQASALPVAGAPATPTAWQAPQEAAYWEGGSPASTVGATASAAIAVTRIAVERIKAVVLMVKPSDVFIFRLSYASAY